MPKKKGKNQPKPQTSPRSSEGDGSERLQKVLAAAGLGSRRQCEELILDGRVEVDGETLVQLGTKVDPVQQTIRVDGEPLKRQQVAYIMLHKPEGVVSTARDPAGRPRVTDMVPPEYGRLFPVGRLDMSSEGLILLTNDGPLANRLTHPRYGVEKHYHVQVAGQVETETLRQLREGMYLAEGFARVARVRIKSRRKQGTILEMVLDEGRNREIRRLLAKVGHKVQRLVRVAIGPLRLGELPRGAYRELRREEVQALREAADKAHKQAAPRRRRKANQGGGGPSQQKKSTDEAEFDFEGKPPRKIIGGLKQSGQGRPTKGSGKKERAAKRRPNQRKGPRK